MTDFDDQTTAAPAPVTGEQLMNRLGGKTKLTNSEMDDWVDDTRTVREASRPVTTDKDAND
ncbi:MAG: hypothetical protein ACRDVF_01595 [Microbacterium sp.]|uniref:hypothetical protein n=1 Tax=Microbacterium sp. TaxID=51671 RepID=UPI003D6F6A0B